MVAVAAVGSVVVAVVAIGVFVARKIINRSINKWDVPDLTGKVFLVTGTTGGIGLETVRALGAWKADVLCANRSVAKSRATAPPGALQNREVHLASFASVRAFAQELRGEGRKLDVLVLNAGTTANADVTKDGVDTQYQVNHLSHFLLANLLLPLLAKDARIVFVSSMNHYAGKIDKAAYSASAKGADPASRRTGMALYSDTKLMNVMTAVELNHRLQAVRPDVAVTAVHPGFTNTNLDNESSGILKHALPILRWLVARDAASGAMTTLRVATDPLLAQAGGRYFQDDSINRLCVGLEPAKETTNASLRRWLWETSAEIVGISPEIQASL